MTRPILTSVLLGLAAGMVTAIVLTLMHAFEQLIWFGEPGALRIALTILAGGALIAVLRFRIPDDDFDTQLDQSREGARAPPSKAASMAALGIVSVGFGGAIGPEAGILAVVAELSALISMRIAQDVKEAQLIGQIGAAGALGGLYGSPPGAASYTNDGPDAPWPLLVLAALAGLAGIMLAGMVLPDGPGMRIPLPATTLPFSPLQMLHALAAGLAGALAGAVYVGGLHWFSHGLRAISRDVRLQVIVGTAVFALLAATFPVLRFNGQHELAHLSEHGTALGAGYLVLLALLKVLALALCLSSKWLGGPIMPLAMGGAAAGAALAAMIPGMDLGLAAAAGVAACCTVGMNKPLVVLLVLIFMVTNLAPLPLVIGIMMGWLVSQFLPSERLH
ncbi:chloride channel protein [Paracoccus tegillarcae]|nr:chloride channel protein [Paracoccus tegillarcae]